ncbi:DNA-formamidopyrimidine glycosylase family protein, partial [Escherichia coli]|uniref:DNA-formamidopyrimidine glycosylase family protein n=1 Tax=Escherichia coli TaxID=562 RepID=UPI0028675A84
LKFTALLTALPAPDEAYGHPLLGVDRRGKYLLLEFEPVQFAVHLMQGGRLLVDDKQSAKPRGGQARFVFDDCPALLLT